MPHDPFMPQQSVSALSSGLRQVLAILSLKSCNSFTAIGFLKDGSAVVVKEMPTEEEVRIIHSELDPSLLQ